MTRYARIQSSSGIYHVTMKGINGQDIFEEDRDNRKFLFVLEKCIRKDQFEVFAYCLMSNHVHLLLRVGEKSIGSVIQRIGTTFAGWYNNVHGRSGHLFQNRFHSVTVDNAGQLRMVWRYILQNPMKAGLEEYPGEKYMWSSIYAYLGIADPVTVTDFVMQCFGSKTVMMEFLKMSGDSDRCKLEMMKKKRLSDETAMYILKNLCEKYEVTDFAKMDRNSKRELVGLMYQQYKLSLKQITRITGLSYRTVRKYGVPVKKRASE